MAVFPVDDVVIGQFTKRLRLEQRTDSVDSHGGRGTPTYALRDVVWASVEPLTNREAVQAAAVTSTLGSAITIWYRTDISVTDRLLLGARIFEIQSYQDPTGQQVVLRLICTERQS